MKAIVKAIEREIEEEAVLEKSLYLVCWSAGKVYTQIILDAESTTLVPIIEKKAIPDSIVYSDCWRGYNTLDGTDFNHSKLFTDRKDRIDGIENLEPSKASYEEI